MNFQNLFFFCFLKAKIHRITPVRSTYSPHVEDEIHQLRAELSASSAHCLQLEEANRAWQQFHQNQLDMFRSKLQHLLPMDESFTLDQLAQQIIDYLELLERNKENQSQFGKKLLIFFCYKSNELANEG